MSDEAVREEMEQSQGRSSKNLLDGTSNGVDWKTTPPTFFNKKSQVDFFTQMGWKEGKEKPAIRLVTAPAKARQALSLMNTVLGRIMYAQARATIVQSAGFSPAGASGGREPTG